MKHISWNRLCGDYLEHLQKCSNFLGYGKIIFKKPGIQAKIFGLIQTRKIWQVEMNGGREIS